MSKFVTAYSEHSSPCLDCGDEVITKQSFADDCDINNIMARYAKTGVLDHCCASPPQFGDVSNARDYASALNIVIEAQAAFDSMPAKVRARFKNEPEALLAFLEDPNNRDEAVELGLVKPAPAPSGGSPQGNPSASDAGAPAPAKGAGGGAS